MLQKLKCQLGWHVLDKGVCRFCGEKPYKPTRQEQRHEEMRTKQWEWLTKPWK